MQRWRRIASLVCLVAALMAGVLMAQGEAQAKDVLAKGTWGTCSWAIDANGLLTVLPGEGRNVTPGWLEYRDSIRTIRMKASGAKQVVLPANSSGLFQDCERVTNVDLSGANASRVEDASFMFKGMSSLESVKASKLDTSHITNMEGMFAGCSSLKELDVSAWDTSSVKRMGRDQNGLFGVSLAGMFSGCSSLTELDVSGWDVSKLRDASAMFDGCSALLALDVSGWDTSALQVAVSMFSGCSAIRHLNVSSWDVSNVRAMGSMFAGCSSLRSLNLKGWDTSMVGNEEGLDFEELPFFCDMADMFEGCTGLRYIAVGELFNVQGSFPAATAKNGKWWSKKLGAWVSAREVMQSRVGVADTYRRTAPSK